jgi:hypothetical protein
MHIMKIVLFAALIIATTNFSVPVHAEGCLPTGTSGPCPKPDCPPKCDLPKPTNKGPCTNEAGGGGCGGQAAPVKSNQTTPHKR